MDPGEFRCWYDTVAPDLRRYARRLADSAEEADDVFQETFARFLGSGFEAEDPIEQRRYLFRIATNLARDRKRWSRRWGLGALFEQRGKSPEKGYGDRMDVRRALALLPPRSRALLWLAYAQGLAHKEIANVLGVAPASVRVLLSRARKKFLENIDEGDSR